MLKDSYAFSGFSVDNIDAARQFYGEKLGLEIEEMPGMGMTLKLNGGGRVFVYAKPDHVPASFTILNFPVSSIDAAVDALIAQGIHLEHYDDIPAPPDEKGIMRGLAAGYGPDIAWFKDPAGNTLAILQNE